MPPPRPATEVRSGSLEPGRPSRAQSANTRHPAGRPHTPPADRMYATDVRQHHRLMPPGQGVIMHFVDVVSASELENWFLLMQLYLCQHDSSHHSFLHGSVCVYLSHGSVYCMCQGLDGRKMITLRRADENRPDNVSSCLAGAPTYTHTHTR